MKNIELINEIELVELLVDEQKEINGGSIESIISCCLGACYFTYQIGKDMKAKGW